MIPKIRVFISSTIKNLSKERKKVTETLESTDLVEVIKSEDLPAMDVASREVCYEGIDNSDLVILIISDFHGHTPKEDNPKGLSVTHLEYKYGRKNNKSILTFIKNVDQKDERITKFIEEVEDFDKGLFRKTWENTDNLCEEVLKSVNSHILKIYREKRIPITKEIKSKLLTRNDYKIELNIVASEIKENSLRMIVDKALKYYSEEFEILYLPMPNIIKGTTKKEKERVQKITLFYSTEYDVIVELEYIDKRSKYKKVLRGKTKTKIYDEKLPDLIKDVFITLSYLNEDSPNLAIDFLLGRSKKHLKRNTEIAAFQILLALQITLFYQSLSKIFTLVEIVIKLENISREIYEYALLNLFLIDKHSQIYVGVSASKIEYYMHKLIDKYFFDKIHIEGEIDSTVAYTYAKFVMKINWKLGIKALEILPTIDPFYEQRWYWYRDLGLCYCSLGEYDDAAKHYEIAADLRKNDSELFRFAGDAYYYNCDWLVALICYEKAIKIEPTEYYFLKEKMQFIKSRKISKKPIFNRLRKGIANKIENLAGYLVNKGFLYIGIPIFYFATKFIYFLKVPNEYLAYFYNRRGKNVLAVRHLNKALNVISEDPKVRADLALNKYYVKRKIDDEIEEDIKISFFHGGSTIMEIYQMGLIYNPQKAKLLEKIREIEKDANSEYEERKRRRQKLEEPEIFNDIVHVEL